MNIKEHLKIMGTLGGLEDLAGLAADMARLEMDRDTQDIVFVVSDVKFREANVDIFSRSGGMRPVCAATPPSSASAAPSLWTLSPKTAQQPHSRSVTSCHYVEAACK